MRLAAVLSVGALTTLFAAPASAEVTQVSGGAFGFRASVSLFGGPATPLGPAPTVTLPSSGASPAITASEPQTEARYGPAIIYSSSAVTVSTEGSLGANGVATSSADLRNVNRSTQEVFTAERLQSSCRATETGASGSTTVTNGKLRVSEGNPEVDGDDTDITIPANPAPNTEHQGNIEAVGDKFRAVFNEQISQAGGVTVNAYHLYLLGPTAVGEVIVGQSVCAINASAGGGGGGGGGSSPTSTTVAGGGGSGSSGSASGSGSSGSAGGGSNMPKTGLDVLPLTVVGTELVAGGVAALVWAGRRRRWPRR